MVFDLLDSDWASSRQHSALSQFSGYFVNFGSRLGSSRYRSAARSSVSASVFFRAVRYAFRAVPGDFFLG